MAVVDKANESESETILKIKEEFDKEKKQLQNQIQELKNQINDKNETITKLVLTGSTNAGENKKPAEQEKPKSFEETILEKAKEHLENRFKKRGN